MDEIISLLKAADSYATEKLRNSSYFFIPILLRLLYCTGMRISEALTLAKKDVDLRQQLITIRCSKNGTERIIPMSGAKAIVKIARKLINRIFFVLKRKTEYVNCVVE